MTCRTPLARVHKRCQRERANVVRSIGRSRFCSLRAPPHRPESRRATTRSADFRRSPRPPICLTNTLSQQDSRQDSQTGDINDARLRTLSQEGQCSSRRSNKTEEVCLEYALECLVVQVLQETLTLNACIVDQDVESASRLQMRHRIGHTLRTRNIELQHFGCCSASVEFCLECIAFRRSAHTRNDRVAGLGQSGCSQHAEPTRCACDKYSLFHGFDLPPG